MSHKCPAVVPNVPQTSHMYARYILDLSYSIFISGKVLEQPISQFYLLLVQWEGFRYLSICYNRAREVFFTFSVGMYYLVDQIVQWEGFRTSTYYTGKLLGTTKTFPL